MGRVVPKAPVSGGLRAPKGLNDSRELLLALAARRRKPSGVDRARDRVIRQYASRARLGVGRRSLPNYSNLGR